uniref:G_PROTEIN_RECEP_F1_2 domain-containing protein n=1 Tax=Romanomermis culicivorax TaxID=13658 RepID=A0A915KYX2_ROMCU
MTSRIEEEDGAKFNGIDSQTEYFIPMNNSTENLDTTSGAVVYYILAANVAFLTFYLFFITIFINHSKHLSTSCYIFIKFLCMADICILISLLLVNITYNGIITTDATFLSYMRLSSDLFGDGFGYFPTLFVNILIGFNRFTAIEDECFQKRRMKPFRGNLTTDFAVAAAIDFLTHNKAAFAETSLDASII